MPLVIPVLYAQCGIEIRQNGDPDSYFTTFGLDVSDSGVAYDVVLDKVAEAWADTFHYGLDNTHTTTAIHLKVGQDGGPPLVAIKPVGIVGGGGFAALPQNCAALIDKFTTLGGKRGRGRMFMPGFLAEGQVDGIGVLSTGLRNAIQSWATLFRQTLSDEGIPMVLLHNTGGSPVPPPSVVTSLVVQSTISTQRNRLR